MPSRTRVPRGAAVGVLAVVVSVLEGGMSIYITRQTLDPAPQKRSEGEGGGLFQRLFGGILRDWQRRRMIDELEALDDQLLKDIGINRGDIERLASEFHEPEPQSAPEAQPALAPQAKPDTYQRAA